MSIGASSVGSKLAGAILLFSSAVLTYPRFEVTRVAIADQLKAPDSEVMWAMQIEKNTVVAIDYTLTDDDGRVLDTSQGREPLSYLHGTGGIIPGLERELNGKQSGDELQVAVAPEDAYGVRNEALRQEVPREKFEGVDNLDVGMQFRVDSSAGPMIITVVDVGDDVVVVDGNHPLAGVTLNFAVTVRDVREATSEELAHGHAHGADGNSH